MIPYGKQYLDEDDIKAVIEVLRSDFITQGPKIKEFEDVLASYCGAKYAVVFNSGTSALLGAYFACGIEKGDEAITSPITFVATTNMLCVLGAKPVFADVEDDTGNINPEHIRELVNEKTKAIVPVHYAGHPADLEKIREIAEKYNLRVIEDACHALGAKFKGEKIGSCKFSDATVFSFHPVKHITTGEGGAVLTNNEKIYRKLLLFRNHGITKNKNEFINWECEGDWYYEMHFLGYNFRITDIQCALGISQIKKLDWFVKRRREIAETYTRHFRDSPHIYIPEEKSYASSSFHLYPIRLKDKKKRKKVFQMLRSKGIGVQVHYIPVYLQPFYRKMGYRKGICPKAEDFYEREISLPIFPAMKNEELKKVIEVVEKAFYEIEKSEDKP